MLCNLLTVMVPRDEGHGTGLENLIKVGVAERRGSNKRCDIEARQRRRQHQQLVQETAVVKKRCVMKKNIRRCEQNGEQQRRPQVNMPLLVIDEAEISKRVGIVATSNLTFTLRLRQTFLVPFRQFPH